MKNGNGEELVELGGKPWVCPDEVDLGELFANNGFGREGDRDPPSWSRTRSTAAAENNGSCR